MVVEHASQQSITDRERTASGGLLVDNRTVVRGGRDRMTFRLRCTRGNVRAEEIEEDFNTYQEWCDYLDYGGGWTAVRYKSGYTKLWLDYRL